MTSGGRYSRRRRSQSASSPTRALFLSDNPKWRMSTKRTRLSSPRSPSYKDLVALGEPPEKWDVDQWRRGKRARRDTASKERADDPCMLPSSFAPPSVDGARSASIPELPCTSAAFDLFPERRRRKSRRISPRSPPLHVGMPLPEVERLSSGELTQLRSRAFSELQRSVEQSSEGLVQRMRDWESTHTRTRDDSPRRRYPPDSPTLREVPPEAVLNEDEDDIEIVSSEPTSGSAHFTACPKRLQPLNMMDIDIPVIEPELSPYSSERCSSPFSPVTAPSAYSSDDDMSRADSGGPMRYSEPHVIPGLTYSYTVSSNPSSASLVPSAFSPTAPSLSSRLDVPVSASPPEKAIAALALVMANGACSLQDYAPIQQMEVTDSSQLGDLWH